MSILISIPLFLYSTINKGFFKDIVYVSSTRYIQYVLRSWFVLVFISLLFPVVYATYDLSFFRVVAAQFIHLVAAIPVFAFLLHKRISFSEVEKAFVKLFVIQTVIQLVVVNSNVLGEIVLYFNHFEPDKVSGPGSNIRGKALSAATTYHLSMAYGICFIIYVKKYLTKAISFRNILVGVLLFVGIFFAGRSGFMGCAIAFLGYQLYRKNSLGDKLLPFLKILIGVVIIVLIGFWFLSIYAPDFYDMMLNQILPYAFEFFYSMDKSGQMEMQSTNRLQEMWANSDFRYVEILLGSGKYSNSDGSYYMHVDPGVLRHTLFMGIIGYLFLIIYQLFLLPVIKMKGKDRYYYILILIFLLVMDLKAVNIGVNKFAFSICLLFSFSYLYLEHESEIVKKS